VLFAGREHAIGGQLAAAMRVEVDPSSREPRSPSRTEADDGGD